MNEGQEKGLHGKSWAGYLVSCDRCQERGRFALVPVQGLAVVVAACPGALRGICSDFSGAPASPGRGQALAAPTGVEPAAGRAGAAGRLEGTGLEIPVAAPGAAAGPAKAWAKAIRACNGASTVEEAGAGGTRHCLRATGIKTAAGER